LIWWSLLSLIEYKTRRQVRRANVRRTAIEEDDDVAEERRVVEAGRGRGSQGNQDQLVVSELVKAYPKVRAVDGLSFGVPKGQCFGLLGVNGAGKTTTFRMMTGETGISGGKITLDGFSVRTQLKAVRQRLGYCPQYDGLIETLTGRELLTLFARLRGIKEEHIGTAVSDAIQHLNLNAHADRLSGTYSGGNKRKLSTAIALVGSPDVVFLDEPTSGMDPGARRFLWNVLDSVTRSGKSIVMTSHSMEECEALCQRIGIMKEGRFMCLGTPQHLKSKFGKGYTLMAKIGGDKHTGAFSQNYSSYMQAVFAQFPGATVKSEINGEVSFSIPDDVPMSSIFAYMQETRARFEVIDYSVAQTTLAEVFVAFASGHAGGRAAQAPGPSASGVLPAGYLVGDSIVSLFKYGPDADGEYVNLGDEGTVIGATSKPGKASRRVAATFPGVAKIGVDVVDGPRMVQKVFAPPGEALRGRLLKATTRAELDQIGSEIESAPEVSPEVLAALRQLRVSRQAVLH